MRILLTNDDGIYADGLYHLATGLIDCHEVYVVAPDRERSATGHAITLHTPLRVDKIKFYDTKVNAWSINGTPSDCVKIALDCLLEGYPDIVLSGINRGANLGTDIIYSGTVSAAIEASIYEVPAIALSVAEYQNPNYVTSVHVIKELLKKIDDIKLPKQTLLNVNIPSIEKNDIVGIKITKLGIRKWKNTFDVRKDPRGRTYYWMGGEADDDNNDNETDIYSIKNNWVTITPIHFDLTCHESMTKIKFLEEFTWGN
jgi:5'-nucleotidase